MKAIKLILATVLFTSLTSLSFAGAGPQFWTQQAKNKEEQKAKASAPAESPKEVKSCASCACCTGMSKG